MVITLKFDGQQQLFHYYWLPLMYKHNECKFIVEDKTTKMIYPKDVPNLEVISNINNVKITQPILHCQMNKVPTYKSMIEFQKKKAGEYESLGEYYEVPYELLG
tara:strand:- start:329 stop:640 length:312 start_codon:yes stop_codon:yes gene_type:complete